ncbi:ankyrin repeat domain-containing protein 9 [Narcine bancroftii]|uniref:ankyrin repeat domain-containing protein 9 n=1 Tax=Narcine bancroftii TaxID=1343680 RepID=UPI003831D5E9
MPWNLDSPPHGHESRCQKRCKKSSFAFYQAVRDLLPVWILEEMRTMEVFHWEESGRMSTYSPSEALLYALVHDHQRYGHYLLRQHPQAALAVPSDNFCCCRSSAPHLAMAVRYNRVATLGHLLKCLRRCPDIDRSDYLNRRGCVHVERGKTPLHVACELVRPECLTLLLSHGSSPYITDCEGNTPLDALLLQLGDRRLDPHRVNACLHSLLLFMPQLTFKMKAALRSDVSLWQSLLAPDTFQWLSGCSPPPLFIKAVQSLIAAIAPEKFPEGLDELPIAHLLQLLDLKLTVEDTGPPGCQ